jgi:hypothetical protein
MTDSSRKNTDFWLFTLAFLLALVLRLAYLGWIPLSDAEANWALQAFNLTKGAEPALGAQPGYVMLTALVFYVLQASNFAARLIPALAGALLALAPLFFRDRLGSKAAIVLAFGLAIEPGLLSLSRQAGTPILALMALVFAWGCWRTRRVEWAGFFTGLALLSGPQFWPGLAGLALAVFMSRGLMDGESALEIERKPALTALAWAAGTYFLLGSLFLLAPGGLGQGLAAIPEYFRGWATSSETSLVQMLLSLLAYQPLALVFGLVGLARGLSQRDPLTIFAGIWLGVALVLALAYPSREVAHLAWAVLPLWVLAAREISLHLQPIIDGSWETIGMAGLTAAILIFAWLNFSAIALTIPDPETIQLRWYVQAGSLALLVLSTALVALGWSIQTAIQGTSWGILGILLIATFSTSAAGAGLRTYRTVELWRSGPQVAQDQMLASQLDELSRYSAGAQASLDISIVGINSPALRWMLRDWPVTVLDNADITTAPSIVITPSDTSNPELQAAYRGQDVLWRQYPGWGQFLIPDWLKWFAVHTGPQGEERIILWSRTDLFVDSQNIQP